MSIRQAVLKVVSAVMCSAGLVQGVAQGYQENPFIIKLAILRPSGKVSGTLGLPGGWFVAERTYAFQPCWSGSSEVGQ